MDAPKTLYEKTPVVYTDKAQCRDCYRCVRRCPVKAIGMEDSQAAVSPELCIACGTCVKQCPQGAKKYRRDLEIARELLGSGRPVAASIAPSFAALLEPWQRRRMPSMLRQMGFAHVAETAVGAWAVAQRSAQWVREHPNRPHIATACPAVVAHVEKYHPECVEFLMPVVSPMIAHARMLRRRLGPEAAVVFIGPCVAKKAEADRPEYAGEVDCVLTFEELADWTARLGLDLRSFEDSGFDETPPGRARHFALPGGELLTAEIPPDMLSAEAISVSGFDEVDEMLAELPNIRRTLLIEPLMCRQGCINGPATGGSETVANIFRRRAEMLAYATADAPATPESTTPEPPAEAITEAPPEAHAVAPVALAKKFSEAEIQAVLARTGKTSEADQLNCGACGYETCRAKAIAVLRGLAEPEMCIPYMRRLAERRTDRIIETSPNGIVILDKRLNILSMNGAFREMFRCGDAVCGRPVAYLMDPGLFEQASAAGDGKVVEQVVRHEAYGLTCHQVVYALGADEQYVGIFVNVTRLRDNQQQLDALRRQTLDHARQLHDQQIEMARRIAEFLGQSTARSETLLEDLMAMTRNESDQDNRGG